MQGYSGQKLQNDNYIQFHLAVDLLDRGTTSVETT